MRTTYLDQNALIALGRKARKPEYAATLKTTLSSGALSVVLSPWHMMETAHTTNLNNATELAEFIDSLKPSWLLERHDLQRVEVSIDFFAFIRVPYQPPPLITTRSAAFATLLHKKDHTRFDIPSRRFVEQWIRHPEQMKPVEDAYRENADALRRLRELRRDGKITPELRKKSNRRMLEIFVPQETSLGISTGRAVQLEYLDQADIRHIPTLSIETAISEHEWGGQGRDDWNSLMDKFHLISALPYVDEIVSNDKFFHEIYPVATVTGHVRAKLIHSTELLRRIFDAAPISA